MLLSLRDFQDDKADVIVKYTADEARNRKPHYHSPAVSCLIWARCLVKAYGELPENAKINETDTFGDENDDCVYDFADEGEMDIDDL